MNKNEIRDGNGSSGGDPGRDSPAQAGTGRDLDEWFPDLYAELRVLARRQRSRGRRTQAPGTTSIVHEAYERLSQARPGRVRDRGQFFAMAAKAMRSILVDNARRWQSLRRGGHLQRVSLDDVSLVSSRRSGELLALDEALAELEESEPRLARVVTCRVFGGLNVDETAEATGLSSATVKRDWRLARNRLYRMLAASAGTTGDERQ